MRILTNYWLLVFLFAPILGLNLYTRIENTYSALAFAFLNRSFSFLQIDQGIVDAAYYNGQYYWPRGPFPAVILMPFVWLFGPNFQENFLKFPLNILNFWLIYKISKSLKLSPKTAIWLAIFFIFGSIYTPIAVLPYSTYFAHVITTCALLLAIYLFLNHRHWILIGSALAIGFLTRTTAFLTIFFFLSQLLINKEAKINLIKLTLPILTSFIIFGFYNFVRFGNPFETGYRYHLASEEFAIRKSEGLFSPKFIPTNLYYMIIKTPDPVTNPDTQTLQFPFLKADRFGMSIFFLSPILFLLFKTNFKDRFVKASLASILLILIPLVTYSGIGVNQVGFRYALDFFPLLLIPLSSAIKRVKLAQLQILTVIGVLITWFFIIQILINGF